MWRCPKCKQEFDDQNQEHFCSGPHETVDAYIAAQPEHVQPLLYHIRDIIHNVLPEAEELISWKMPTYRGRHNIIHFASYKKHIGLYPGEKAIEHFSDRLKGYRTSKGAVQFPYDVPLPDELIGDIAKWCYETENHH